MRIHVLLLKLWRCKYKIHRMIMKNCSLIYRNNKLISIEFKFEFATFFVLFNATTISTSIIETKSIFRNTMSLCICWIACINDNRFQMLNFIWEYRVEQTSSMNNDVVQSMQKDTINSSVATCRKHWKRHRSKSSN